MILSIRTSRLLQGYRNLPLGDLDALEEALLRVSALVNLVPEMVELDLNPVKVLAPGQGVRPVDARIRVKRLQPERSPELADLPSTRRRRRA
jgi:acyl-CoA synthetase (NDP forming)